VSDVTTESEVNPAGTAESATEPKTKTKANTKWRMLAVVLLAVGLAATAKLTGLDQYLSQEKVQELTESAGIWGFGLFILIFTLGELIHIPGFVFVGAAAVAYEPTTAAILAYAGAVVSVSVSFAVVRLVGGKALAEIEKPLVKKILSKLDSAPIRTVAIVRLVFWMAPPVNYALAMTRLRFRDHFIGSAIGLLLPMIALVFGFEFFSEYLFD
jgi:uncharacterized membrane protein YdjX (TVP38/TMEM64 family)